MLEFLFIGLLTIFIFLVVVTYDGRSKSKTNKGKEDYIMSENDNLINVL